MIFSTKVLVLILVHDKSFFFQQPENVSAWYFHRKNVCFFYFSDIYCDHKPFWQATCPRSQQSQVFLHIWSKSSCQEVCTVYNNKPVSFNTKERKKGTEECTHGVLSTSHLHADNIMKNMKTKWKKKELTTFNYLHLKINLFSRWLSKHCVFVPLFDTLTMLIKAGGDNINEG